MIECVGDPTRNCTQDPCPCESKFYEYPSCKSCKDGHYGFPKCHDCKCNTTHTQGNQVWQIGAI